MPKDEKRGTLMQTPFAVRLYQDQRDWLDAEAEQRRWNRQELLRELIDFAMGNADLPCPQCERAMVVYCSECDQ